MNEKIEVCLTASAGFAVITTLGWFFSSRPRLFIRVFVPSDELPRAARAILRNPQFSHGMRVIAILQYAVAAVMGAGALAAWSCS